MLNRFKNLSTRLWFRAVVFTIAYYAVALLSREVSFQGASFSTFWFPSGLFVAVLLLNKVSTWPAYLLAALPAVLAYTLHYRLPLPVGALLYITGTLEAATGAWLIRRFDPKAGQFENPANVLNLVVFSAMGSSALSATIDTTVLATLQNNIVYGAAWRIDWISHGLGTLVAAPLILTWANTSLQKLRKFDPERLIELAILIVGLFVCSLYIFVGNFSLNRQSYLVVPFLVWMALRFGPRMTSFSAAIITLVSAWGTAQQLMGFAYTDITIVPNMETIGSFLAITLGTCFILTTVWEQSKNIEKALRESEARYRMLIENQGEGVGIVNANEVFTFANPAAAQIFGVDALINRSLKEFTPPQQFSFIRQQTELRQAGKRTSYELEIFQPGGKRRSLWITATPEYDSSGAYSGTFAVFHDITERKQAEIALRDSRARFQTLFDHSPVPIWEEDFSRVKRLLNGLQREGIEDFHEYFCQHPEQVNTCAHLIRVLDVNQAALQLLGFSDKSQLLGQMNKLIERGPDDLFIEELVAIAEGKT